MTTMRMHDKHNSRHFCFRSCCYRVAKRRSASTTSNVLHLRHSNNASFPALRCRRRRNNRPQLPWRETVFRMSIHNSVPDDHSHKFFTSGRLRRCYGHVLRKDENDCMKNAYFEVEGVRPRGRRKKTWGEVIKRLSDSTNMQERCHGR